MKKLFLILSFTLLTFNQGFGQAQIDIPLDATDGSIIIHLNVGLDLTATNCIDPHLGESDIPPIPPTGMFDARFDLQPFGCGPVSTYKDYRPPGSPPAFPFTGLVEHIFWYQVSSPATPIEITYNLPPGAIMTITDQIGGVFLNIGPFSGQGVATIPGSYTNIFTRVFLKMQYNNIGGDPSGPIFGISTISLNFPQLIVGSDTSLPVTVSNYGITNPLSISSIISSNSHFTVSPNTFPINIEPLSSQVFQITNTSATTAQQGAIQFTHNAYGSPTSLNVSAPPGMHPGPILGISTWSLIFPQKPPGTIDSLPVIISNQGYLNSLYINNINSSNSYFNIFPNSVPIVIAPQSFKAFYITYTSADSLQQGTIEFTHNAPGSPSILNVSSVYSQSQFSIYPASVYFYSQPLTKSVWVSNTGNYDSLFITDIISSNSNYTITPNNFPISILPGTTAIFRITLNNSSGFQFGTINFFHSAAGLPSSIFVSNQLINPQCEGRLVVRSGSVSKVLKFGLDPLATDGIDGIFEESDLPPMPPPGAFDSRFILPENNFSGSLNSYNDFRFGSIPFIQQKEYRIHYQQNYNNGIEIKWHLPHYMTGVLQDIINGSFINIPLADSGSFVVPDPILFNKLKMLIDFNRSTPVELVSFTASLLNYNVQLNWSTATETNNSGFEIERQVGSKQSAVGNWEMIGFVPGFGTTTELKSYSFVDENVISGTYKYRLKQIDFDGSFTYSNEIEVEVDFSPKEFVLHQNYPNPFNPSTKIKYEIPLGFAASPFNKGGIKGRFVALKVYDVLGKEITTLVNEAKQPGVYEVEFNSHSDEGQNLSSGVYFYQLKAGNFLSIKKMVLTK